jgi:peptidoglycan-associated lipoprotein
MRTLWCGVLLCALLAAPAAAQDADTRPALPTIDGDTGLWFVPTADTLPKGKVSGSLFLANDFRFQGVTKVEQTGPTIGVGVHSRVEIFGSFRVVGIDRDLRPLFVGGTNYGGIAQDAPYVQSPWTGMHAGPGFIGGKVNLLSQSRQNPIDLALRVEGKIPGSKLVSDHEPALQVSVIASGEAANAVELTATVGGIFRKSPPEFATANSMTVGVGASFPSRSPLRALIEAHGEFMGRDTLTLLQPTALVSTDGSIPPLVSSLRDFGAIRAGIVWQSSKGIFVHAGASYTVDMPSPPATSVEGTHNRWGLDVRVGFHPGVKKYTPPPPPPPPPPAAVAPPPAPAPPPNRNPVITSIACDPCTVEIGQTLRVTATATDPDGDPVTIRWSAPAGTFNPVTGTTSTWTAPNQEGSVPATATATDGRGGVATRSVQLQVIRPPVKTFMFEDVHFDFDKYNLKPEALKILDDAVVTLRANPDLKLSIEGHCDSVGTPEYNLALGERRANAARDYLVSRGIDASRFTTVSYGKERPIADNSTEEGRAQNRRAALVVKIQ